MTQISLFAGVKGINRTGSSMWDSVFVGEAEMDDKFDPYPKESQQFLKDMCSDLKKLDVITKDSVVCWIDVFEAWVNEKEKTLPLPEKDFSDLLLEWVSTDIQGRTFRQIKSVGLVKDKLIYSEFSAKIDLEFREPSTVKKPYFDKLETFVQELRNKAPASFKSIHQTAGFTWVWMPSEVAFVTSAVQGIMIAMVFAFCVLLIATRNII